MFLLDSSLQESIKQPLKNKGTATFPFMRLLTIKEEVNAMLHFSEISFLLLLYFTEISANTHASVHRR